MTLYIANTTGLEGRAKPRQATNWGNMAAIAYKAAIDALGRMHDAGNVVRYGRKRSSTWALTTAPAGAQADPLGAVEEAWRARPRRPPPPRGGGGRRPPGLVSFDRSHPQNFSRHKKVKIFFGRC